VRPQDRGQVAGRVRHAGRGDRRAGASGQDRREPARGAAAAAAEPRAGDHRTDVALDGGPETCSLRERDVEALRALYARYGFNQALRELDGGGAGDTPGGRSEANPARRGRGQRSAPARGGSSPPDPALAAPGEYETILDDEAQLDAWIARLREAGRFAFDTETDSLDPMRANLVGLSFASSRARPPTSRWRTTIPARRRSSTAQAVLAALRPLLEDPAKPKLGQHGKYDLHVLRRHGIDVRRLCRRHHAGELRAERHRQRHDMDSLAQRYLGYTPSVRGRRRQGRQADPVLRQVALDDATRYAAEDADITLRLHRRAVGRSLRPSRAERKVYREIEMPLVPVLARIEANGVLIDADAAAPAEPPTWPGACWSRSRSATELAGRSFNLDSPKQLQALLFDELGCRRW
jgi:DNA polymerase I